MLWRKRTIRIGGKKKSQKRLFSSPEPQQQTEKVAVSHNEDKPRDPSILPDKPQTKVKPDNEEDVPSFNIFGNFDFDEKNSQNENG